MGNVYKFLITLKNFEENSSSLRILGMKFNLKSFPSMSWVDDIGKPQKYGEIWLSMMVMCSILESIKQQKVNFEKGLKGKLSWDGFV